MERFAIMALEDGMLDIEMYDAITSSVMRHGVARIWEKDAEAKLQVDYLSVIHQGRREPHPHERHCGARRLEKNDTA